MTSGIATVCLVPQVLRDREKRRKEAEAEAERQAKLREMESVMEKLRKVGWCHTAT